MDQDIKRKIDAALARIKEPQSDLPIADLGLVGNIHYSEAEKTIVVTLAIGSPRFQCPACSAINGVVRQGIERRALEEFQKEFPAHTIVLE